MINLIIAFFLGLGIGVVIGIVWAVWTFIKS